MVRTLSLQFCINVQQHAMAEMDWERPPNRVRARPPNVRTRLVARAGRCASVRRPLPQARKSRRELTLSGDTGGELICPE